MKLSSEEMRDYAKIAIVVILFVFLIPLSTKLTLIRSQYMPITLDRPMGIQILTEMIGEIRTIIASYIFIRADLYHHEREEKIDWRKDKATLPLHRLVTALDPKFEQAYDFGAYHLGINLKKPREAINFLLEGLHYNPKSFKLNFTMGDIFYIKKEYGPAAKYHMRAFNYATNVIDKLNALRRLYWEYRYTKNYDMARNCIEIMKSLRPNDVVIKTLEEQLDELQSGKKTEEDFHKESSGGHEEPSDRRHEHNHNGHKHGENGTH